MGSVILFAIFWHNIQYLVETILRYYHQSEALSADALGLIMHSSTSLFYLGFLCFAKNTFDLLRPCNPLEIIVFLFTVGYYLLSTYNAIASGEQLSSGTVLHHISIGLLLILALWLGIGYAVMIWFSLQQITGIAFYTLGILRQRGASQTIQYYHWIVSSILSFLILRMVFPPLLWMFFIIQLNMRGDFGPFWIATVYIVVQMGINCYWFRGQFRLLLRVYRRIMLQKPS